MTATPVRRFAPWTALALVVLLIVVVLGAGFLVVPADRSFEYGGEVRVQLLSIDHETVGGDERVTWKVSVVNGTGGPLDLNLSSTCRHAVPPLESGPSALAEQGGATLSLPEHQGGGVADSCPSPESGRWWAYSLTLEDGSGDIAPRTVTFMGRAH
ncbi:hypothetical protein [Nocardiopsis aegyptia]|uniref:Uncharacterized protein n=1 Tax=Nocardiopsis aegyptia TaxID=220378 RepID=A0A7Z0J828_9ACTN|nr:hypothetical protein [Nocardiopsis aegyptia]NYJ32506.1 hypothetical protein [Nocardiopsis aegyptia]